MKRQFRDFTPLRESGSPKSTAARGGRIYKNVTIIKSGLGNRRDRNYYPPATLQEAAKSGQFEGLRAFADHPDALSEETRPERSIRDIVGVYTNTKFKESGGSGGGGAVVGDLRILKSASWLSDMIDELVDVGQSDKVGISINGRGQTEPQRIKLEESGEELDANVLQKFLDLKSADLVTEAGAGGGFQQLLESARGAKESTKMTRSEFKSLKEAAAKGDKDAIKKLAKAAEAAVVTESDDEEAEGGAKKKKVKTKEAKVGKKVKTAKKGAAVEEVEEADADAELDATAQDLVDAADADEAEGDDVTEAEGDESSDDDAEADDEAEGDETEEADADDAEGDETEEADADADDEEAGGKKKKAKTRESAFGATNGGSTKNLTGKNKQVSGGKPKNTKGVKTSGAGAFTKNSSGPSSKGNKFGYNSAKKGGSVSGRTREAELEAQLAKSERRNERLAEALKVRQTADKAKKMLRESKVPENLRPNLLRRMVGRSEEQMREEIDFTERLLESAGASRSDEFDDIEGAGSSIRESFGHGSRSGEDDIDSLIEGLPLREAADDEE